MDSLVAILFFILFYGVPTTRASNVIKKFDETFVPQEPVAEIKCGSCPCVNPCALLSPPPPPPPPPPLPPPPPKTICCTPLPPPPPRFIYVTGVPGCAADPCDNWDFYSAAPLNAVSSLLVLAAFGVLHLMINW